MERRRDDDSRRRGDDRDERKRRHRREEDDDRKRQWGHRDDKHDDDNRRSNNDNRHRIDSSGRGGVRERRHDDSELMKRHRDDDDDERPRRVRIVNEDDDDVSNRIEAPDFKPSGKLLAAASATTDTAEEDAEINKEKPDFKPSGKLAQDTNMFNGVLVKYTEPPESRKPKVRWRLYPFKGDEALPVVYVHRQSAYLIGTDFTFCSIHRHFLTGRDRKIADLPIDHPSCSKQHAALQYRSIPYKREDGSKGHRTRPYIIDLGSANGTYLNNERIDSERYVELKEKDVLKFGFSTRDYVLLNEKSQESDDDDDEEEVEEANEQIVAAAAGNDL